jgi:IS30 family transposase
MEILPNCLLVQKLSIVAHITVEQRYQIQALLAAGNNQSEIAEILGKNKSVISRELSRNRLANGKYKPEVAQAFYRHRRKQCRKASKWDIAELRDYVEAQLREDKSPEQISGVMHKEKQCLTVSHEAIYQYVWEDKRKGGTLCKHLRNRGRRYQKRSNSKGNRSTIVNRIGIEHRPEIVEHRKRVGDYEIDLVMGKNHKNPILSIVERKSGFGLLRKLPSKEAEVTARQIIDALLPIKDYVHTITADNGKEFAKHEMVTQALEADFYFATPYHSWERGVNENYNRLLRQYFPKKTSFENITDEQLKAVQDKLNNRERKRLGFVSPIKYLQSLLLTKVAFAT